MDTADLERLLVRSRVKVNELLDSIAKAEDPMTVLAWRPGAGRAHTAWQLMHIAATDDRHLHVRMQGASPAEPLLVSRFAGGSIPDDDIPSLDIIRAYLTARREAMIDHLRKLKPADLDRKPNDSAPWIYRDWFEMLAWHEAHHQGQAHLTLNLYRALNKDAGFVRTGH